MTSQNHVNSVKKLRFWVYWSFSFRLLVTRCLVIETVWHWCYCVALMLLRGIDVTAWHWCYCVALMLLCGTDVTVWHWCYCVALMLLRGIDVTAWHWCYCVALMLLCGTDVTAWHWCYCVALMFLRGTDVIATQPVSIYTAWLGGIGHTGVIVPCLGDEKYMWAFNLHV